MNKVQSKLVWLGVYIAIIILAFPPIVQISGSDTARVRYFFILTLPQLHASTFLWPATVAILGFELAIELLLFLIINVVVTVKFRRTDLGEGDTL